MPERAEGQAAELHKKSSRNASLYTLRASSRDSKFLVFLLCIKFVQSLFKCFDWQRSHHKLSDDPLGRTLAY